MLDYSLVLIVLWGAFGSFGVVVLGLWFLLLFVLCLWFVYG